MLFHTLLYVDSAKRRKSAISNPLRNSHLRQKKEMVLAYVTY